jgi:hypothetical protein
MSAFNKRQFLKDYRKRYRVSRLRQWWHRSSIKRYNERPCPTCHGNDRVSDIREGFACITLHCDRCGHDYYG